MALRVVHYPIHIEDPANRPDTPFSAVLLADLHNTAYGRGNSDLIEKIDALKPRFILSAGDLITAKGGRSGIDHAAVLVHELAAKYPVYLVSGNHEMRLQGSGYPGVYETYCRQIQNWQNDFPDSMQANSGALLVDNRSVHFDVNGMRITVNGYAVPMPVYRHGHGGDVKAGELEKILGKPDRDRYQILLAHHPDSFEGYSEWGADLTLSGHVHGGIVRLPFIGGVVGASIRLFPPYTRGVYENSRQTGGHTAGKTAAGKMIVSAGLGSHTIKLRINNPTELVCLDFQAE